MTRAEFAVPIKPRPPLVEQRNAQQFIQFSILYLPHSTALKMTQKGAHNNNFAQIRDYAVWDKSKYCIYEFSFILESKTYTFARTIKMYRSAHNSCRFALV